MSVVLGVLLAIVLILVAPGLASAFRVEPADRAKFVDMLRATGAALVLFMPALVLEGLVKGFERFGQLRVLEVAATMTYAALTVALIRGGYGLQTIQYAFLGVTLLKYLSLAAWMGKALRQSGLSLGPWTREDFGEVWHRSSLLVLGKFGSALQSLTPPLIIAALSGPSSVGLYDMLMRLPRFLKPALGILASAVLPAASRLHGAGNDRQIQALGRHGTWLPPFLTLGPIVGLMLFSEAILLYWVGSRYAEYASWLALALTIPACMVLIQFGLSALQIHRTYIQRSNRLLYTSVVVQFMVSFAVYPMFLERSFILGQAVALVGLMPWYFQLVRQGFGITDRDALAPIGRMALVLAVTAVPMFFLTPLLTTRGVAVNVSVFCAWCICTYMVGWLFALTEDQRNVLQRAFSEVASKFKPSRTGSADR